ncbi:DNA topoisomerase IB [Jannaschia aquimarina]|uniref:DNA topoisomerase n=1 Tax=Jannaschia aquimarina TaxID=935700 RepID=A0A0D1EG80_9RHOB|nr:DNA topoisomerase IB [Jannaschia aquimarina]KIT16669.1 Eukaryotic DNA topoisomerase I, catalytic core [Jannaschia aquimarina]SNS55616.1 DNA topoisomerase-1 [Jannaschia aquimarina]
MTPDLIYYPDDQPGITRRRAGRGWSYRAPDGTTIDDARERARIDALAVPPAYSDVWISPKPLGHLQATGKDARTRKQYRYHPEFRAWQERRKFDQLPAFGEALPRLRRRVADALKGEAGERDFAIAAVLRLIDRSSIRIGSEAYRAENGTEGATTLRAGNIRLDGNGVRVAWRAKGGQRVRKQVSDRTLARALDRLSELPGAPLFEWIDGDERYRVQAVQVNDWLAEAGAPDGSTAKTFRTWNGSVAALAAARKAGEGVTIKEMSEAAAERLHNTPTIARNSYIHPAVIDLASDWSEIEVPDAPTGLKMDERALLGLIL